VGGLAFLINDGVNGFHVPTRDPEALAERIHSLLVDADRRDEISRQAREHARHYAWTNIAERMLQMYVDVIENKVVNRNGRHENF
jgi:D-inositol-3-phosphate glycosyltransferase